MKRLSSIKDSILMRLWLIWVAFTKRSFLCFAFNSPTSGRTCFSHLHNPERDGKAFFSAVGSFGLVQESYYDKSTQDGTKHTTPESVK